MDPSSHALYKMAPTVMFCDSEAAIKMVKAQATEQAKRTKHIELAYHYIRYLVSTQQCALIWCSTKEQIADVLTKPLVGGTYTQFRSALLGNYPEK
jgi:hypothetical protein